MTNTNLQTTSTAVIEPEIISSESQWDAVNKILQSELVFNFTSAGETRTAKIHELPAESIALLLSYGCRKLNDTVNSRAKDNPDLPRSDIVESVWGQFIEGELGQRRAQTSDKGFKDFIFELLRAKGYKVKDFEKVRGATPFVIIQTFWSNVNEARQNEILRELEKRYEQVKALANMDI